MQSCAPRVRKPSAQRSLEEQLEHWMRVGGAIE
ncbi:hypothetical protein [Salinisphaera sp.]|nr:hypothetical protein [Salinisphaera sp.]